MAISSRILAAFCTSLVHKDLSPIKSLQITEPFWDLNSFVKSLYCSRLSFPVFIQSEYESFPLAGFAIPVNISSVFGKSFCTPA